MQKYSGTLGMRGSVLLILGSLLLAGCGTGGDRLAPEPLIEPIDPMTDPVGAVKARDRLPEIKHPDLKAMRSDIMKMIDDTRADNVEQCRVVGFGHKPCGGPASYIAFSVKNVSEQEAMARIGEYNAAAQASNVRQGLMSDCSIVPEPAVTLQNGRCTLAKEKTSAY